MHVLCSSETLADITESSASPQARRLGSAGCMAGRTATPSTTAVTHEGRHFSSRDQTQPLQAHAFPALLMANEERTSQSIFWIHLPQGQTLILGLTLYFRSPQCTLALDAVVTLTWEAMLLLLLMISRVARFPVPAALRPLPPSGGGRTRRERRRDGGGPPAKLSPWPTPR